jgi:hypothetical protein
MKLLLKKKTTLEDLPAGSLFLYGDTLGLKSEYYSDSNAIEAYIIGSGEMFWGGTKNVRDQKEIVVMEVQIEGL